MKTSQTEAPAETISASELPDQMNPVLNAVEFKGVTYIVTRHGSPVARIVPLEQRKAG